MLTACGPQVQVEMAMRQQQVDVKYGHAAPAQPSPTPAETLIPPAPFTYVPPTTIEPAPTSAPAVPPPSQAPSCPKLNTLAVPKDIAPAALTEPPVQDGYVMRSSGTYSLGATKGNLPPALGLFVSAATKGSDQVDGNYEDYAMVTAYDSTHYWAFTLRLAPDNAATPGILMTSLHWKDPVRGNLDFVPQQSLQLVQTPLAVGNSWTATGVDPVDQTSVELQGSVPRKDTVNACGTALDSYQVHIAGEVASPTAQLSWTADYDLGTQYGGLILAQHVVLGGPDSNKNTGDSYSYDETSIINSVPLKPQ